jgi:hypothetical protein
MEGAVRSGLFAAIELRQTVLSVPGLPAPGLSASGHSSAGYSDSVLSGSEANATTSTIGERQ